MRIHVFHDSYYDWEPVPTDATVTAADIKAKLVKPGVGGAWLMRVTKQADGGTHTLALVPESEIIGRIIEGAVRERVAFSRSEAIAHYLARETMPHHAHRKWITGFDVHDDGGAEPELFAKTVDEHIAAGNIPKDMRAELVEAYAQPLTTDDHIDQLHTRFGVPKKAAPAAPAPAAKETT